MLSQNRQNCIQKTQAGAVNAAYHPRPCYPPHTQAHTKRTNGNDRRKVVQKVITFECLSVALLILIMNTTA